MVILMDVTCEQTMSSPVDSPNAGSSSIQAITEDAEQNGQSKSSRQAIITANSNKPPDEILRSKDSEQESTNTKQQQHNIDEPMVVSSSSSIDEEKKQTMSIDTEDIDPGRHLSEVDQNVTLKSVEAAKLPASNQASNRLRHADDARKDSLIARMRDIVEGSGQQQQHCVTEQSQAQQRPKSSSDSLNNNNENLSKASVDSAQQKRARHHYRGHHHCRHHNHNHNHHHHHHHAHHRHRPSVSGTTATTSTMVGSNANTSNNEGNEQAAATLSAPPHHHHHHHHHHHRHHHSGSKGQQQSNAHHHHHHHHHRNHQHLSNDGSKTTMVKRHSTQRHSVAQTESLGAASIKQQQQQQAGTTNETSSSASSEPANKTTTNDQKLGQTFNPDQENSENKRSIGEQDSSNQLETKPGVEKETNSRDEQKEPNGAQGHQHYHHAHPYHHHHHHHCHHRGHKKRLVLDVGDNKPAAVVRSGVVESGDNPSAKEDGEEHTNQDDIKREPLQDLTTQSNVSTCCSQNESHLCSAHQNQLKSCSKHHHHHSHHHGHPHHHHHHAHHVSCPPITSAQQDTSTAAGDGDESQHITATGRAHHHHHHHAHHAHHRHHRHHHHHHHHHGGPNSKQRHRSRQKSTSKTNLDDLPSKDTQAENVAAQKDKTGLVKQMSTDEPKTEEAHKDFEKDNSSAPGISKSSVDEITNTNVSGICNENKVAINNEVVGMETSPNNESRLSKADEFVDSTASDSNLVTSIENLPDKKTTDKLTASASGVASKIKFERHQAQPGENQLETAEQQMKEIRPEVSISKEEQRDSSSNKDDVLSTKSYKSDKHMPPLHDDSKKDDRAHVSSQCSASGDNGGHSGNSYSGRTVQHGTAGPEVSSHRPSVAYQPSNNQSTRLVSATNTSMPPDRRCRLCWCCCCPCSALSARNGNARPDIPKPTGSSQSNSPSNKCPSLPNVPLEEIRSWAESFDRLMKCHDGRKVFQDFLRCEYSEENILFWTACEELKAEKDSKNITTKARDIYENYISILSSKEVSLDSRVRDIINNNIKKPTSNIFDEAQLQIYTLMHRDSYPRFINSAMYKKLAQLPTSSRKSSS